MRLPGFAAVATYRVNSGGSAFGVHVWSFALEGGALENPLSRLGKSLETHTKPKKGGFTSATSVIRADGDVLSIGHT